MLIVAPHDLCEIVITETRRHVLTTTKSEASIMATMFNPDRFVLAEKQQYSGYVIFSFHNHGVLCIIIRNRKYDQRNRNRNCDRTSL